MHSPKTFAAVFAGFSLLILSAAAVILIPAGVYMIGLPCLTLRLTGYVLVFMGISSAGIIVRILLR